MKFFAQFCLLLCVLFLSKETFSAEQNPCKSSTLKGLEEEIKRLPFWDSIYQCAKPQNDFFSIGHSLNCIAALVIDEGDTARAFSSLYQAERAFKNINETKGLSSVYLNLGYANDYIGRVSIAIRYYYLTLELSEKFNYEGHTVEALINLATSYQNQLDFKKAEELFIRAIKISEKIEFTNGLAYATSNLATLYYNMSEYDKAIEYSNRSLKIRLEIGDEDGEAELYNNLSVIYREQKKYDLSNDYLDKAIAIHKKLESIDGLAYTTINKSKNLLAQKKYTAALNTALDAYILCKKMGSPAYIEGSAELLYSIYEKLNNPSKALEYFEIYLAMHDSIMNASHKKEFTQKEIAYTFSKKQLADSIKNVEKENLQRATQEAHSAELKKERNMQWAIVFGLVLLLGAGFIVYRKLIQTNKQSAIIYEQKQEIDHSFKELDEKNKEVMDSIRYAARIQRSLITSERYVSKHLNRK